MYVAYSARKKEWYLAQGTSSFRDRVALYLDRKGLFRVKECSPDEKNRNVCSWTKTRAKIKCADSMTDCESRPLLIKVYHNNILQLREILTQKPRQSYYYHSDDKRMEIRKTNNFWYLKYDGKILYKVYSQAPKPELITESWDYDVSVTLQCVGNTVSKCFPLSLPCLNSGVCHKNDEWQSWCMCKYDYYGSHCKKKIITGEEKKTLDDINTKPLITFVVLIPLFILPLLHLKIVYRSGKRLSDSLRVLSVHAYGGKIPCSFQL